MKDLSIVIVTYNSKDFLRTCLNSVILQTKGISFETIVVDNASSDQTRDLIEKEFPDVKFIRNDHNVGFAAANNLAIKETSSRYVLLLNPDTEILDGAIQKMIQFMDEHSKAGISSCKLMYQDGSFQANAYSFPTIWNMFTEATFLYRLFPKTKLFGSYHLTYLDYSKDNQVDWLIGAFYLIRREVIKTIGLLDEQYFMYTEDLDYCYLAKKAGFEIWYSPKAKIYHFYGGMSGISERSVVWTHRSQILFYKKYFESAKIFTLILFKCVGLILRMLRYFIVGMLTADKKLLKKAWLAIFSLFRIIFSRWNYQHGYSVRADQWEV